MRPEDVRHTDLTQHADDHEFPMLTFADHFRAKAWKRLPRDIYTTLCFEALREMRMERDTMPHGVER